MYKAEGGGFQEDALFQDDFACWIFMRNDQPRKNKWIKLYLLFIQY